MQPIQGWEYDTKKYREAITKKQLCKVDLVSLWGENPAYDKLSIEKMRKEYHEYCPKSKSNNIIFCPKKIINRKKDKKVKWINNYFKNFGKKSLKKINKKRRGREKKSKPNTNEMVNEIKEKVNNIWDKFNIKLDDINQGRKKKKSKSNTI